MRFGLTKQKFLDPEKILFNAGLGAGQTIADLGAGSGYYAMAAAKLTGDNGMVYVADILEPSLEHVSAEGRIHGFRTLHTQRVDLEKEKLSDCASGSCDMVLMANILHQIQNKPALFKEAYRLLKTGGKLVVMDWDNNPSPIGPLPQARVSSAEIKKQAANNNLKFAGDIDADQYHYALIFIK